MMDFVISQQLAKARHEELLENAANARRANRLVGQKQGLNLANMFNNIVAELKLRPSARRRAATRI